jgi:acetyl-CoA carboxylase biotin carboxyl carrier protein
VADDKRDAPRPFDVRTVEYLLKLMTEHDLSEVELKEGDQRIRLRKGSAIPAGFLPPVPYPGGYSTGSPSPAAPNPGTNSPVSTPTAPAPAAPARNLIEIKSPMVGTFYSKPKPDKPDYVSVGGRVNPTTVVCQVEAMKLFNEITADCAGTIVEICVKNGDFIEFNQVLFRVEPA